MKIRANGIDIEVEDTGEDGSQAGRPVVLLIMGLGMQLVAWPPAMVDALVKAGYRVIRHDNRDIGLSQHFDEHGAPNVVWASIKMKMGLTPASAYSLHDMALDAVGVLDALKVPKAHIVGVSMGGMIAQRVALAAPDKVLSLTSIMSSSGARGLPDAESKVLRALFTRPKGKDLEAIVDHFVKIYSLIGSPGFSVEPVALREDIMAGLKRNYHPVGTLRQMVAIGADTGKRAHELNRIKAPTLVLHGRADSLVPFSHGEDTARRIPGAKFIGIDGMGHDLPPGVVEHLLRHAIPHMQAA